MAEGDEDWSTNEQDASLQEELNEFRARWRSEITSEMNPPCSDSDQTSPWEANTPGSPQSLANQEHEEKEDEARELFLRAAELEQSGALYEAIRFYRQAMQLVPNIEFRIRDASIIPSNGVTGKNSENNTHGPCHGCDSGADDEVANEVDMGEKESLWQQQQQQQHLNGQEALPRLCQPAVSTFHTHISALPVELLMYMFRWVVSIDLDLRSLEMLSMVCRGFYICARDPEVWRLACVRAWGRVCGQLSPYTSWRHMFLERPRVRFDGVYISCTSYIRQGEPSLDGFYQPWHLVEYYRYLRFFPDGQAIMLTTPNDPQTTVARLRTKNPRIDAVLSGHYRLSNDRVDDIRIFAVFMKQPEKEQWMLETMLFRRQRCPPVPDTETSFHVVLGMAAGARQRFGKLQWVHHACHRLHRASGETTISAFEVDRKYPPFFFSRVRSFTAVSERPL